MDTNIKAYFEAFFLKTLREGIKNGDEGDEGGEGKFGLVPPSLDPNSVLTASAPRAHMNSVGPKSHPLLATSQQFSGIDRRLTANPIENETAQELYPQLRLQNENRLQYNHGKRKAPPKLTR